MLRVNALCSGRLVRTNCQPPVSGRVWALYAVIALTLFSLLLANRRHILVGTGLLVSWPRGNASASTPEPVENFKVVHSDKEWQQLLKPAAYNVLRQQSTERPNSSPLAHEESNGTFLCGGCDSPLFMSGTKFDSGTGWPSFFDPIKGAVQESTDASMFFMVRTEVHCSTCGGHLGHVFDDGPKPTGKRYCMNGAAMKFRPMVAPA